MAVPNGELGALGDRDIWRTADVLIKSYGDEAELIAANRADAMLDQGDLEGQIVWKRILAAVRFLTNAQAQGPLH